VPMIRGDRSEAPRHPPIDRAGYRRAAAFLNRLKYRRDLTWMQWRTLRGQALSGDIEGAERGLDRIMRRNAGEA
jgi:hypothetical protein